MKKNNVTSMIAGGSVLLTLLILLSGFILSMNKISGSDTDDGQYVIEAADPRSFKVLSDDYKARQFAVDKHHAYCGNLIIPDFNPGTAKSIGNGYFTDNQSTVYCTPVTKQNEEITGWKNHMRPGFMVGVLVTNRRLFIIRHIREMVKDGYLQPVTCINILKEKTDYKKHS